MENTPNNNFNNFNGTNGVNPAENPAQQNFQVPPVAPPPVNQGYAPNFPPPAYQYPPQYVPTYTPPTYTAPNTNPYGYQVNAYNTSGYQQSPSAVYNSAQTGAPQYHYGNSGAFFNSAYYLERQEKLRKKKEAEKEIRHIGNVSGALLIACFIIAFIFSLLLAIPAVEDLYNSSLTGSSFINMLYSIVVVGGTFLLFGRCYKAPKKSSLAEKASQENNAAAFKINYSLPKNKFKALLLIVIGFGGCMVANIVSSYILTILEAIGVYSTYSSIEDPKGITDSVLMFLSVAIIPPLVEEFAMRGVASTNLRKYGNAFAILASSFMFGIFHGNAAQILFAFICGLFFAYTVIATDSIWPAVIMHGMNNALSCISSILLQVTDEKVSNIFFYACCMGGIALAGVALIVYLRKFKEEKILSFQGEASQLTLGQKMGKFIGSPVMIVAIIIYGIEALLTLTTQTPAP